MMRAIQLHQLAEVRTPLPATAMESALAALAPEPRLQQPAPQRLMVHFVTIRGHTRGHFY
jgi:hypothetical protein